MAADAVREIAVAAFLRGATYREATNAPTPPDDVILSMLGQAGILPADGECPSCGSRGPVGSVCRGHDAPAADGSWRGPIRAALSPAKALDRLAVPDTPTEESEGTDGSATAR